MSNNKKRERARLQLNCKRYVKAYLLANYNSPDAEWKEIIDLSTDKVLYPIFVSMLKRNEGRYDNRSKCAKYNATVSIALTMDQFRRYGWMLSNTETLRFNRILEYRVKRMLYSSVGALRITGMPISDCIRRFRLATHITECDWDTDSIRKDLQRHLPDISDLSDDFLKKIEEKVWCTLSQHGTTCTHDKKQYKNEEL
jgi:hypothetical protein